MNNHRRMARMLGALVASMTIGALCLDWMKPAEIAVPKAPGIELMALGPTGRAWEGIRIRSLAQDPAACLQESHFVVYRNGNTVQTPSWEAQRVLGLSPVVEVTLLAGPGTRGLTSIQRTSASNLVRQLQQEYAIPSERIAGADKLAQGTHRESSADLPHLLATARGK